MAFAVRTTRASVEEARRWAESASDDLLVLHLAAAEVRGKARLVCGDPDLVVGAALAEALKRGILGEDPA